MLLDVGEHDNQLDAFLVDHSPEVLGCSLQGSLSGYEELVILRRRGVDVVRIYVRVVLVLITLQQADAGVLEGL